MKLLKFVGCFIVLLCLCMLPVILGGAQLYTSAFGAGLAFSMVISAVATLALYDFNIL